MACIINPKTDLLTGVGVGVNLEWSEDTSLDVGGDCSTNGVNSNPGSIPELGGGGFVLEPAQFTLTGLPCGDYTLYYRAGTGDCTNCGQVDFEITPIPAVGPNINLDACDKSPDPCTTIDLPQEILDASTIILPAGLTKQNIIDLFGLAAPTFSGSLAGGGTACDPQFNGTVTGDTAGIGANGIYDPCGRTGTDTITFTITNARATECLTCEATFDIVITVAAAPDAGTAQTGQVYCNA